MFRKGGCFLRLHVVGEKGSGKSSLLKRLADDEFSENEKSVIDVKHKHMKAGGKNVTVTLINNNDSLKNLTKSTQESITCHGIIMVCDLSVVSSIDKLAQLHEEIMKLTPQTPLYIIGTKCDVDNKNLSECKTRLEKFANAHGCSLCSFVSSKTRKNVNESIIDIAEDILSKFYIKTDEVDATSSLRK